MVPFEYVRASDEPHARALAASGGRLLAGGTTLLDLMKLAVEHPASVVDINGLPLAQIQVLPDQTIRIGALVRNSDMATDDTIGARFPVVVQALLAGASPQLRNMATTGGNLLQRTRCYYFRDTAMPCNKREPGSGCPAIHGYNRIHAVLGTSTQCIATHPSDLCVALTAVDAVVRLSGPRGERTVPVPEFHLEPGDHPERESVIEPGELITAVDLPPLPCAHRSLYLKVRDRASYAFALASAAVVLDVNAGIVRHARIALGGVGTTPWRAREVERALVGRSADVETYQAAADLALAGATPQTHNGFKIELAKRTLVRALTRVGAMA
jgi:xanthine dehydrogenase YagS FAD-binding subunit